ncbi:hypothetical protein BR93DRAFT_256890 [Coniochaeta sp. PMI_546]|nr:hypothetical protein BR93DRAFT_256890 [Coniochaeta sp. PMI_546]
MKLVWSTLGLLLAATLAQAQCLATGIDYTDGGQYVIDASSTKNFSFATIFSGCDAYWTTPILHDPDGEAHACSDLNMGASGVQQISFCNLSFSQITTGNWSVTLIGSNFTLERDFYLVAGPVQTVTYTVTPTVIVGYTTTPIASTTTITSSRKVTALFPGPTVTASCSERYVSLTTSLRQSTTVLTSTVIRTSTSGSTTLRWTVFDQIVTASCHLDSAPSPRADHLMQSGQHIKLKVGSKDGYGAGAPQVKEVAATTITYVETTHTSSSTFTTIAPTPTRTETTYQTTTSSITLPLSTFCYNPTLVTQTVTVTPAPSFITNTLYSTKTDKLTLYIITTMNTTISNAASATACWREGGLYY